MSLPDAPENEAATFYDALRGHHDVDGPIVWHYLIAGIAEDRVEPLMRDIAERGFFEVEPLFDEEREGRFLLGFREERVHTRDSFVERVSGLRTFAEANGGELIDYSAGVM